MIKKVVIGILFIAIFTLIGTSISGVFGQIPVALSGLSSSFALVASLIAVPFTKMLTHGYIAELLAIGVFIFLLSYIIKLITGHHLQYIEDEETGDQQVIYRNPNKKVVSHKTYQKRYTKPKQQKPKRMSKRQQRKEHKEMEKALADLEARKQKRLAERQK